MGIRHKTLGVLYVDSNGVVQFGFNDVPPTRKSGIELLLQNILIRLFTNTGSHGFDLDFGGDLLNLLGGGYFPDQVDTLRANFSFVFSAIEEQIKEEQSYLDLPREEVLRSIKIKSIEYNDNTQTWNIIVRVLTDSGSTTTFSIVE